MGLMDVNQRTHGIIQMSKTTSKGFSVHVFFISNHSHHYLKYHVQTGLMNQITSTDHIILII